MTVRSPFVLSLLFGFYLAFAWPFFCVVWPFLLIWWDSICFHQSLLCHPPIHSEDFCRPTLCHYDSSVNLVVPCGMHSWTIFFIFVVWDFRFVSITPAVWTRWADPAADSLPGGAGLLPDVGELGAGHGDGLPAGAAGPSQRGHEVVQDRHEPGRVQRLRFDGWGPGERHDS